MQLIQNNVRVHNVNIPVGELTSRIDRFTVLFLQSYKYPIYEHHDTYEVPIDDDILWNTFGNVKVTIRMIKNGEIIRTQWNGPAFKGHRSEGMEWTY